MKRNWFDAGGDSYLRFRPDYPDALAAHLAACAPRAGLAVDVGCGNGQFTRRLAAAFDRCIGLDPSVDQIAHAVAHDGVRYAVASAEATGLGNGCADCITAAQAAHWFDLPRFYAEARRIAAPGAVLALISYGAARFANAADAALDGRLQHFHSVEMGRYWPAERQLVEEGYASIDFPFVALVAPPMDILRDWTVEALLGYVSTWSAVRRAREAGRVGLLAAFAGDLRAAWGDPGVARRIRWPIAMRLGVLG